MKIPFSWRIPRMCKRKLYLWVPERGVQEKKIIVSGQLMSCPLDEVGGTQWQSSLRHCTTSRKVVGSIPEQVIGLFHLLNHSGLTMALGSSHTLNRNEYQGYIVGGKGSRGVGLTT